MNNLEFKKILIDNGLAIQDPNNPNELIFKVTDQSSSNAFILAALNSILNKLIAAPSTEAKQDVQITKLTDILNELKDDVQLIETIWTDSTGAFFIREVKFEQDTQTKTVNYILPNGTSYNPTPPIILAVANKDKELVNEEYKAINNGTGYNLGDYITRTDVIDTSSSPIATVGQIWFNKTQQSVINTAPLSADIEVAALNQYATEPKQDIQIQLLSDIYNDNYLKLISSELLDVSAINNVYQLPNIPGNAKKAILQIVTEDGSNGIEITRPIIIVSENPIATFNLLVFKNECFYLFDFSFYEIKNIINIQNCRVMSVFNGNAWLRISYYG